MIAIRKLATIAAATAMSVGLLTGPAVSAQITATSAYDCPGGFTCLYSQTGGYGERLIYQDEGYWQNLRFTAKSIYNNRGNDAAVALQAGGQGVHSASTPGIRAATFEQSRYTLLILAVIAEGGHPSPLATAPPPCGRTPQPAVDACLGRCLGPDPVGDGVFKFPANALRPRPVLLTGAHCWSDGRAQLAPLRSSHPRMSSAIRFCPADHVTAPCPNR